MHCPHFYSISMQQIKKQTVLNYQQFRCYNCGRQYNKRTGAKLNFIEYPTEVVMIAVHYYYRFKVSLDDVVELMSMRGFNLCHQTVNNWVQTFGVDLGLKLCSRRKGKAGVKGHAYAPYVKVEGRWCYLYRAIDKERKLVVFYLSDVRDQATAEAFFGL